MSKIIVLMGAPGAGKGTQARLLQERLHLPHISTGDIFRGLKNAGTPLAQEVNSIMQRGQLVPDEVTTQLVKERIAKDDCRDGYILDGFPRTPEQAATLEKLAAEDGKRIIAVQIDVPDGVLEKRLTGRRNCPVGGEIYNVHYKPPQHDNVCDIHPEAQLVQRADDNTDTVLKRLVTYAEQTRPLIEYYRSKGLLHSVDGSRETESIYKEIEHVVRDDE